MLDCVDCLHAFVTFLKVYLAFCCQGWWTVGIIVKLIAYTHMSCLSEVEVGLCWQYFNISELKHKNCHKLVYEQI